MGVAVFREIKQPERDVNYSRSPSVEIKNYWSYPSAPCMFLHGVSRVNVTCMLTALHF